VPGLMKPTEESILSRFEDQARIQPQKIAIEDFESAISYRDLNRLANRIAHAVLSLCGPESEPVALLVGNGIPVVAAMLGVLKAGKFYVTLDASQPAPRTSSILAEVRPRLLIVDAARLEQAETLTDARLLNLDSIEPGLSEENPALEVPATNLAYVVFTSGSTGGPKGVMQDHRYVLHLTQVYTDSGKITARDRLALLYSPSFAGAVRDIYCALLNGGTLLTFDVKREGLASLAHWLRQKRITVFFAVATIFRHFCRLLTSEDRFPAVRLVELGSETVYAGDARLFQRHFSPDCCLIANLGGSEISPVCQFPIDAATRIESATVPAGYPAEGVEVLLWDTEGRPVEAGCTGEIVVRSRYLSRGYWGDPELTAAAFLPDPQDSGRNLFRTGDLGRMLPDGCLLHLGRCDFQVKIRGYRVEVAEIEAFFTGTRVVRDAVVTTWEDENGEPNLAAWLVPARSEAPPSAGELRALATASLPDYMVPAKIVLIDSLPTTENGKLDRRALPGLCLSNEAGPAYRAPRTAVELRLHEIWSEIFGRERIGVDENFFDLGGHSLSAMQAAARIADSFRVMVRPNVLFEAPTLAQLAKAVEGARRNQADAVIQSVPRDTEIPLSLAQSRLWIIDQMDGPSAIFNMVRVFRLKGPLNLPALDEALAGIGRRHENLRTSFSMSDAGAVQIVAPDYTSVLCFEDLSKVPENRRESALDALLNGAHTLCFDLAGGPLWRVRLIRVAENSHVLHLAMHHIISDGWSIQVLLRELSAHYSGLVSGNMDPIPELAVQYSDYARWQRRWLTGERLEQQLDYWRQQLREAPALVELPLDRARREYGEFQPGMVRLQFDAGLAAELRRLARDSETTLFVTLLAAYAALLAQFGNAGDVVIGTAVANRYPVETEALIGFFVNTLPLRLRWQPGASFRELQACAHLAAMGAYAHPDVPFDRIVDALQLVRSPSHSAVFQTLFVFQNVPKQELALAGSTATEVELERPTAGATFDLTLSLKDADGTLHGALEFNAALFDFSTMERMASDFGTLLTTVVQNPDAAVAGRHLAAIAKRIRNSQPSRLMRCT
jgi:amino acid adenylation domain-containing protein